MQGHVLVLYDAGRRCGHRSKLHLSLVVQLRTRRLSLRGIHLGSCGLRGVRGLVITLHRDIAGLVERCHTIHRILRRRGLLRSRLNGSIGRLHLRLRGIDLLLVIDLRDRRALLNGLAVLNVDFDEFTGHLRGDIVGVGRLNRTHKRGRLLDASLRRRGQRDRRQSLRLHLLLWLHHARRHEPCKAEYDDGTDGDLYLFLHI